MARTAFLALAFFWLHALCHAEPWSVDPAKLVTSARSQIGVTIKYDPAYRVLKYPNGDVPKTDRRMQ